MEKRPFAELGLSPEILKAVDKMGYEEASPIQTAVIPAALRGRDVVGQSSTGSGQDRGVRHSRDRAGRSRSVRKVQVLILCPTRELAVQVAEETRQAPPLQARRARPCRSTAGSRYERQFRALAAGRPDRHRHAGPGDGPHGARHAQAATGSGWSSSTRPTGCSTWVSATTSSTS